MKPWKIVLTAQPKGEHQRPNTAAFPFFTSINSYTVVLPLYLNDVKVHYISISKAVVKQPYTILFVMDFRGLHKLHDGRIKPWGSGNQTCPSKGLEASCPSSPASLHLILPTHSSPAQYFTAH